MTSEVISHAIHYFIIIESDHIFVCRVPLISIETKKVKLQNRQHYMLNIWPIFITFEQQKGLGQICYLKA